MRREIACSVAVAFTRLLSELAYGRLAQSTGGLPTRGARETPRRGTGNSAIFGLVAWMGESLASIEWPCVTPTINHQFMKNSMKNCSFQAGETKATKAIPL